MKLGENEIVSLLNEAKYLLLHNISEPEENSLRLVIEEAIVDHTQTISTPDPASPFAEIRKGASPIKVVEGCRRFELQWSRYVAYLVTEEVVGSGGSYQDEVYTGKLFREYTKSHFLDLLARDTGGHFEPILHYKLISNGQTIRSIAWAADVRQDRTLPENGTAANRGRQKLRFQTLHIAELGTFRRLTLPEIPSSLLLRCPTHSLLDIRRFD